MAYDKDVTWCMRHALDKCDSSCARWATSFPGYHGLFPGTTLSVGSASTPMRPHLPSPPSEAQIFAWPQYSSTAMTSNTAAMGAQDVENKGQVFQHGKDRISPVSIYDVLGNIDDGYREAVSCLHTPISSQNMAIRVDDHVGLTQFGTNATWQHATSMSGPPEDTYSQDVNLNTIMPYPDAGLAEGFSVPTPIFVPYMASLAGYQEPAPTVHIGTIEGTPDLKSIVFRCSASGCDSGTFSRWHELKRHFNGSHTTQGVGEEFWCKVLGCERNRGGGRPFPRKDKLEDHVRKVHVPFGGQPLSE